MASKIKVDQIEGSTSTTVALPSGQTLDLSSGSVTLPNTSVTNAQLAGSIDLTTKVTGTLPVAQGGTGITSLGAAGTALKVNSGGSALEFGAVASKLIGMEKVYFSDTAVSFTGESGTQLSGNTYYPNSAKISGTYNKQQSSSHILMLIKFSMGHSATNVHGSCAWITGQEGSYRNMGFDARQFGWYHDESSVGSYTANLGVWWNGASSSEVQGTGNKTFCFAPTVSGTRTHTHILNFNPYSSGTAGGSHTDAPNRNTHSEIIIMEYEA